MGNGMIALFLAAGVSAWVYNKINRTSGGNTANSLTVAGVAGLFAFVIMLIVLGLIPKG